MNWNLTPRLFEIIQRFRWHRRRVYLKGYAIILFRNWGSFSPTADGGIYTIPADLLDPIIDRLTARATELADCDAGNGAS